MIEERGFGKMFVLQHVIHCDAAELWENWNMEAGRFNREFSRTFHACAVAARQCGKPVLLVQYPDKVVRKELD